MLHLPVLGMLHKTPKGSVGSVSHASQCPGVLYQYLGAKQRETDGTEDFPRGPETSFEPLAKRHVCTCGGRGCGRPGTLSWQ